MELKGFNWLIPKLDKRHCRSQTEEFIIENIKSGNLLPTEPLPPYRQLAELNDVSATTIKRAYSNLIVNCWLVAKPGGGTFVAHRLPDHEIPHGAAGFTDTFPASLHIKKRIDQESETHHQQSFVAVGTYLPGEAMFPDKIFRKYYMHYRKINKNLSQAELLTSYNDEYLKQAISTDLNLRHHFGIKPEMLGLIKDHKASLERVFKILLDKPGEVIINTNPADVTLHKVLSKNKAVVHHISFAADNFIQEVQNLLKHTKIRAIYIKPQCSFPERFTLKKESCNQLIELAKLHRIFIVEEDEDHEFYGGMAPYRPLACYDHNGYVIYLRALSQSMPYTRSLRIVLAPVNFIETLNEMPPQSIVQREEITEKALADMIINNDMAAHQKQLRLNANRDRDSLNWVLNNYLGEHISYQIPENGLMFWLKFSEEIDLNIALGEVENKGVKVPFHPDHRRPKGKTNFMLLGHGHYQIEEAERAAKLLKDIIERMLIK